MSFLKASVYQSHVLWTWFGEWTGMVFSLFVNFNFVLFLVRIMQIMNINKIFPVDKIILSLYIQFLNARQRA